jgi:hypothetical protein
VADINVERRGPSIWPWIVGLIVLALLIWLLVEMFARDETRVDPAAPPPAQEVQPAADPTFDRPITDTPLTTPGVTGVPEATTPGTTTDPALQQPGTTADPAVQPERGAPGARTP